MLEHNVLPLGWKLVMCRCVRFVAVAAMMGDKRILGLGSGSGGIMRLEMRVCPRLVELCFLFVVFGVPLSVAPSVGIPTLGGRRKLLLQHWMCR